MRNIEEATKGFTSAEVSPSRYQSTSTDRYESTSLLISMIPPNARILDIGCGTGSISRKIIELRSAEIVGIEPHPERAKLARIEGITVINGIYTSEIATEIGKFDIVMFADVLEHLVDPVKLLEDVKEVLKPNGIVIASIPNVAHWTVRLRLLVGKFDYSPLGIMDATHLRWFTRKGVQRLFVDAGYQLTAFHSAIGEWMPEYRRTPLQLLSHWRRSQVLALCCRIAPGLFASQHVVSAKAFSREC